MNVTGMIKDLWLASAVTLAVGTGCLELWLRMPFPGSAIVGAFGVLVSIALGPVVLWRRGTRPLIPIASIYCVLMFFVLVFIGFDIAWRLGKVDL